MSEIYVKLAQQCRMMKICEVDIIGNPDTHTIIGLNKEGLSLIEKLKEGKPIESSSLTGNQILLINELSMNGFFTEHEDSLYVKSTYFHVTSHCNLKCPGCYSYETARNAAKDLSLDELRNILDNLINAGLTHLVISGGEPFLRDDLEAFLLYARSKQQIQYIECITNGTLSLDRYRNASQYLDKLTFSLDSAQAEKAMIRPAEEFNSIVSKIIDLQSEDIPVSIVYTIHHGNVANCDELMDFANTIKVQYRFSILTVDTFNVTSPLMLTAEDYRIFHDFIMSHQSNVSVEDSALGNHVGCIESCGAGKTMVSIASDGSIYPCHMFVGRKAFVMGNALRDDIKETVHNSLSNPFHDLNVDRFDHCKDCHVRYVCGGGCRFRAYVTCGSIKGSDPMCNTYLDNKELSILRLSEQSR